MKEKVTITLDIENIKNLRKYCEEKGAKFSSIVNVLIGGFLKNE